MTGVGGKSIRADANLGSMNETLNPGKVMTSPKNTSPVLSRDDNAVK